MQQVNLDIQVPKEKVELLVVMVHPVSQDHQDPQELSVRMPTQPFNNTMLKHMATKLVVTVSHTDPITSRPKWELLELVDPPVFKDLPDLKV